MNVSVIVRAFASEDTIDETVAAVLGQTHSDLQLILIDDGSPDTSPQKLDRWAARDPRVEVVHQKNQGGYGGYALNVGLKRVRGEFTAVCDGDDVWHPEKVARQVALLKARPEVVATFCRLAFIDERGLPTQRAEPHQFVGPDASPHLVFHLLLQNSLCHSAALWRTRAQAEVGDFDMDVFFCADWDLWLRLAMVGELVVLPEELVSYRVHSKNLSRKDHNEALRNRHSWKTLAKNFARVNARWRLPPQLCSQVIYTMSDFAFCAEDWRACLEFLSTQKKMRALGPKERSWEEVCREKIAIRRHGGARAAAKKPLRLHLGCGPNVLAGWENLDVLPSPGVRVHDLRTALPFPAESAEVVFSEQFFEHLSYEEGLFFLGECLRVLVPGGTVRVTTPDLKTIVDDYLGERLERWIPEGFQPPSPCQMVNGFAKNWGHQFLYDQDELANSMAQAGFTNIRRMGWRHSDVKALEGIEFRTDCRDLILQASRRGPGR